MVTWQKSEEKYSVIISGKATAIPGWKLKKGWTSLTVPAPEQAIHHKDKQGSLVPKRVNYTKRLKGLTMQEARM